VDPPETARKIAGEHKDINSGRNRRPLPYITVMDRVVLIAAILLTASPAWANDPSSPEAPPLQTIDNPSPEVQPQKSFVPGHKSKYGGWVRPYYKEGGALPPVAPTEESGGYIPGHYDSDGNWISGRPQ